MRIWKWVAVIALLMICSAGTATYYIVHWLSGPDLTARAAAAMTHALDRKVTIGKLQIELKNPIVMTVDDLHIANAAWGSEPDIIHIGHLRAVLDLKPLLAGHLQYPKLDAEDMDILLERNADGIGNWRFDNKPATKTWFQPNGGIAFIPKNRTQFPTLLNFDLQRGMVRLRTSSGKILYIGANDLTLKADDDGAPVHMLWHGSYNGIPANVIGLMESYDTIRDGNKPLPSHMTIELAHNKLDFIGTMMNPLDMDGLNGQMELTSSNLGELLQMIGIEQPSKLALHVDGPFTRSGDHWRWNNTADHIADNDFTGDLGLDEGPRGGQDHLDFNLKSARFDLKSVWQGISQGPKMDMDNFKDMTNLFLNLNIAAHEFLYGTFQVFDADGHLAIVPGKVSMPLSTFKWLGGDAQMAWQITAPRHQLHFNINAQLSHGDLSKLFGDISSHDLMDGNFDARAELAMSGPILDEALRQNSKGKISFRANGGTVKKSLLEVMSMDPRAIFHHDDGSIPIQSMAADLNIQNGIGTFGIAELTTPGGSLTSQGSVDFTRQSIDMVIKSDPNKSGFFALDVPIHVSGPFTDLSVRPE